MRNHWIPWIAVAVSALLFDAAAGLAGQAGCEIPFRFQGHRIVVEASAGENSGLRFMIDTAATCSAIDKKVVKALGLQPLPGESRILAFGKITKADRFRIPMLRIGNAFATLRCLGIDLSRLGVDGIIGLDLLRRQTLLSSCETNQVIEDRSFTIDYEAGMLRFGAPRQMENTVPLLETQNRQIAVVALIEGHPLRLAVDTGVDITILFKESQMGWLAPLVVSNRITSYFAGAISAGKDVLLPGIKLGNSRWSSMNAILMNLPDQSTDGVLSIAQMGLKILHLDFGRNLMSWKK